MLAWTYSEMRSQELVRGDEEARSHTERGDMLVDAAVKEETRRESNTGRCNGGSQASAG